MPYEVLLLLAPLLSFNIASHITKIKHLVPCEGQGIVSYQLYDRSRWRRLSFSYKHIDVYRL